MPERPAARLEMPQRLQRVIRIICDARVRTGKDRTLLTVWPSLRQGRILIDQVSSHGCLRVCSDIDDPDLVKSRLEVLIES